MRITALLFWYTSIFLKDATDKHREFFTEFCQYSNWIENGEIPRDLHKIETYGSYDKVKEFYKLAKERKINLNIVDLDRHIEITKPGISKGSGIKWICQNVLNIDVNDVMAIGDSQNDISMFQIVGYPYLMENSDPYTRTFGKYFTSTVDQDGLAEAIDDYLYRVDFDLKREISQQKSNKQQN
ncbi:HAD family hydrolase [Mycoplasmopsis cynos]|uniref:HAD family hydrolase n=1 Tax=Mycoplasmopsis cynos TaxID=171284 RepID=UPI0029625077|nr:HAD hydrolase family protein [Mycoplasmopsis cynos]